ncbi:hypothetical protein PSTT_00732 [Puccinia striiformis]|uniref:Kri1-like C-terminal domain-containing protein n=1 Tax=Puccinia striiformis TaxID=27350 RepID=A0A2S4W6G9_9BASI|nr:hypothetical protein PSTT_00732 [Puccinia striiformis]
MAPIDLFEDVERNGSEDQSSSARPKDHSSIPNHSDSFTYNQAYAQKFERQKRGEELMKLKDKYGEDYEPSEDDDEDFSSEDSDAEFITPEVDCSCPLVYFEIEEETRNAAVRAQKLKRDKNGTTTSRKKPMNLRDYHRKALLTNEGREFAEDEDLPDNYEPTPAEEAEALRDETSELFHAIVEDDEDDDSGDEDDGDSERSSDGIQKMLVLRDKEHGEIEQEDEEYQQFLIEQVGRDDIQTAFQLNSGTRTDAPHEEQTEEIRQAQQDDDEFLRSYVLGRGWIDKEAKKIPKYKDLVAPGGQAKHKNSNPSGSNSTVLGKTAIFDEHDEEDEEFVEKAEEFETKYNFRFEDPYPTVTTHARDTGPSARRKDDSRKLGREAVKARKDEEKRQRMEELERMKELKREEVMKKLDLIVKMLVLRIWTVTSILIVMIAGCNMCLIMISTDPDGKPVWEDDIEIDDILPDAAPQTEEINFEPGEAIKKMKKLAKSAGKKRGLDPNPEPADQEEEPEDTREIDDDLEGLSPEERKKKLLDALDEYHKLDCEDMIGDMPTRFKYTNTEATDWMTPEQILMATDAELNQVIGLKKLAPIVLH